MAQQLLEALIDSAVAVPLLFIIYLLIEFLETNKKAKDKTVRLLSGGWGPVIGSGVGIIPQCGFSVLAADLYAQRFIGFGTLIAVFIATSDEALPILLSNPDTALSAVIVTAIKVVYGIAVGYLVNAIVRKKPHDSEFAFVESHEGCCHHDMDEKKSAWEFLKHPLVHTAKIFLYLLVINVLFGIITFFCSDAITAFMKQAEYVQPFVVSLVGLIPNCASSVIITGLYAEKVISFGAMTAGLVTNSGIALAVLFRYKKSLPAAIGAAAITYVSGAVMGVLITLVQNFAGLAL